jgi:C-terminal processing protease CtpA/Prc
MLPAKPPVDRIPSLGYSSAMRVLLLTIVLLLLPAIAPAANSAKNFGGVGIDGAPWADGQIVVKQLVAGGPAHQAGILVGDVITHIDGKPTRGSNFKQMVEHRLRGTTGTPVLLKVRRPADGKLYTFTLIRRQLVVGK